jgi:hypothetical protein
MASPTATGRRSGSECHWLKLRTMNIRQDATPVDRSPRACTGAWDADERDAFLTWSASIQVPATIRRCVSRIGRELGDCQFIVIRQHGAARITDLFLERLERAFATHDLSAGDYCTLLRASDEKHSQ